MTPEDILPVPFNMLPDQTGDVGKQVHPDVTPSNVNRHGTYARQGGYDQVSPAAQQASPIWRQGLRNPPMADPQGTAAEEWMSAFAADPLNPALQPNKKAGEFNNVAPYRKLHPGLLRDDNGFYNVTPENRITKENGWYITQGDETFEVDVTDIDAPKTWMHPSIDRTVTRSDGSTYERNYLGYRSDQKELAASRYKWRNHSEAIFDSWLDIINDTTAIQNTEALFPDTANERRMVINRLVGGGLPMRPRDPGEFVETPEMYAQRLRHMDHINASAAVQGWPKTIIDFDPDPDGGGWVDRVLKRGEVMSPRGYAPPPSIYDKYTKEIKQYHAENPDNAQIQQEIEDGLRNPDGSIIEEMIDTHPASPYKGFQWVFDKNAEAEQARNKLAEDADLIATGPIRAQAQATLMSIPPSDSPLWDFDPRVPEIFKKIMDGAVDAGRTIIEAGLLINEHNRNINEPVRRMSNLQTEEWELINDIKEGLTALTSNDNVPIEQRMSLGTVIGEKIGELQRRRQYREYVISDGTTGTNAEELDKQLAFNTMVNLKEAFPGLMGDTDADLIDQLVSANARIGKTVQKAYEEKNNPRATWENYMLATVQEFGNPSVRDTEEMWGYFTDLVNNSSKYSTEEVVNSLAILNQYVANSDTFFKTIKDNSTLGSALAELKRAVVAVENKSGTRGDLSGIANPLNVLYAPHSEIYSNPTDPNAVALRSLAMEQMITIWAPLHKKAVVGLNPNVTDEEVMKELRSIINSTVTPSGDFNTQFLNTPIFGTTFVAAATQMAMEFPGKAKPAILGMIGGELKKRIRLSNMDGFWEDQDKVKAYLGTLYTLQHMYSTFKNPDSGLSLSTLQRDVFGFDNAQMGSLMTYVNIVQSVINTSGEGTLMSVMNSWGAGEDITENVASLDYIKANNRTLDIARDLYIKLEGGDLDAGVGTPEAAAAINAFTSLARLAQLGIDDINLKLYKEDGEIDRYTATWKNHKSKLKNFVSLPETSEEVRTWLEANSGLLTRSPAEFEQYINTYPELVPMMILQDYLSSSPGENQRIASNIVTAYGSHNIALPVFDLIKILSSTGGNANKSFAHGESFNPDFDGLVYSTANHHTGEQQTIGQVLTSALNTGVDLGFMAEEKNWVQEKLSPNDGASGFLNGSARSDLWAAREMHVNKSMDAYRNALVVDIENPNLTENDRERLENTTFFLNTVGLDYQDWRDAVAAVTNDVKQFNRGYFEYQANIGGYDERLQNHPLEGYTQMHFTGAVLNQLVTRYPDEMAQAGIHPHSLGAREMKLKGADIVGNLGDLDSLKRDEIMLRSILKLPVGTGWHNVDSLYTTNEEWLRMMEGSHERFMKNPQLMYLYKKNVEASGGDTWEDDGLLDPAVWEGDAKGWAEYVFDIAHERSRGHNRPGTIRESSVADYGKVRRMAIYDTLLEAYKEVKGELSLTGRIPRDLPKNLRPIYMTNLTGSVVKSIDGFDQLITMDSLGADIPETIKAPWGVSGEKRRIVSVGQQFKDNREYRIHNGGNANYYGMADGPRSGRESGVISAIDWANKNTGRQAWLQKRKENAAVLAAEENTND